MDTAVREIPETSGKRFGRLKSLGIVVPEQLLLHLPKSYLDLTVVHDVVDLPFMDNAPKVFKVTVASQPRYENAFGQTPRMGFYVKDRLKQVKLVVFGAVFDWKDLKVGEIIVVRAKVGIYREELQLESPELVRSSVVGKVCPIYRGKKGVVNPETMAEYIQQALDEYIDGSCEFIRRSFDGFEDSYLLKQAGITNYKSTKEILQSIHTPKTMLEAEAATLAARKLAAYEVVKESRKKQFKKPEPHSAIQIPKGEWRKFAKSIPYTPTDDQVRAIEEILSDITSPYAMNRLLNGDVGTGKSYVIGVTAVTAMEFGAKVAILTPNLLLVEQLHADFTSWWPHKAFRKVLGDTKTLSVDDGPILIGTVALLSRLKRLKWQPNYLVVDEQEKFSIKQREQLVDLRTNVLESTATCIPRTAAMITHGGMDMSVLRESPVRKKIDTHIVGVDDRQRMFAHVKSVAEAGFQIAIIYPRVSNNGKDEKRSALEAFEQWDKLFPGQVACIHGKMTQEEKTLAMEEIKAGIKRIIVGTTILERGVTISKLKTAIVVNPEMYGVSQLHQIRGRLVRKGGKGHFFLYTPDPIEDESLERLQLLVDYTDGHTLAEMDMEKRGYGDLSDDSEDQHGISRSGVFHGVKMRPSDIKLAMQLTS